jgi:hypothetical protein
MTQCDHLISFDAIWNQSHNKINKHSKHFKDTKTGPAHVRIVVKHCSTFHVGIEHGPTFADQILKKIKGSQDGPTCLVCTSQCRNPSLELRENLYLGTLRRRQWGHDR